MVPKKTENLTATHRGQYLSKQSQLRVLQQGFFKLVLDAFAMGLQPFISLILDAD